MLCQIIILIVKVEEFSIFNLYSIDNYKIEAPCLYYGFLDCHNGNFNDEKSTLYNVKIMVNMVILYDVFTVQCYRHFKESPTKMILALLIFI